MSRFFAGHSDTDSESVSSEEEINAAQQKGQNAVATFAFSDDEEDVKRVVKTVREKRYEELEEIIKKIRNYKKIKDFSNILTSFENLTKAFTKAKNVIDKEDMGKVPIFYIRSLVELDDFITEFWEDREARKNLSKNNSKSLVSLRQKFRKYLKDFETEIASYRESPEEDIFESDDENEGPNDSDSIKKKNESKEHVKHTKKVIAQDDSDADSIDWGSDDDSSFTEDDDNYAENAASRFLKKATDKEDDVKKQKKKVNKEKQREKKKDESESEWKEVRGGSLLEKPTMFTKDAEINHTLVIQKLTELLLARGKKGTNRNDQIELLKELLEISENHNLGPGLNLKIRFSIIAAIYDYNASIITCMKHDIWLDCLSCISSIITVLNDNNDISIGEHIFEETELLITPPYKVRGCVLAILERMDEEFIKILQFCDAHSPEYTIRLKDEIIVSNLILRAEDYLRNHGSPSEMCRIYIMHIEHIYYRYDVKVVEKANGKYEGETSIDVMDRLAKYIYAKDSTDRLRSQAKLYQIYHLALHDEWHKARDAMLMSHIQDGIQHADIPTQILYNRVLVQIGMCFFRVGKINEAHVALLDIQSSGRARELLAQGILPVRHHERTLEQEKIIKRRQIPFHKQINLDLMECIYLTCAMLQEIPYIAAHETDGKKRLISKSYHHLLRNSERQPLSGPPESMREHIVAASKALRVGNWEECKNYIINTKMNAKVWSLCHQSEKVKDMIISKIKEISLRCFLFTYGSNYISISLTHLTSVFKMEWKDVYRTCSKMIYDNEICGKYNDKFECIIFKKIKASNIEVLSLQLADKISNMMDQSERLMELNGYGITSNKSFQYSKHSDYNRFNRKK